MSTQWEHLWELSRRLLQSPSSPGYASTLADFQDASALQLFMDEASDFREEQILGGVIGLLYITELFSASPQAKSDCVRQLPASKVHDSQLDCFVAFGEHLLNNANGFHNTEGGDRDNMMEEIEDTWWDFCTARGVQVIHVKTEEMYPILPPEDEAELFSGPFRKKKCETRRAATTTTIVSTSGSSSKPKGGSQSSSTLANATDASASSSSKGGSQSSSTLANATDASANNSSMRPKAPPFRPLKLSCESVPKFFELAHRILHSGFFLSLPLENLGHHYQFFCKETKNPDGWVKAYSEMAKIAPVPPVDTFRSPPECSFPLLRVQLRKLLGRLRSHGRGTLLRALLTARPPLSMLPHLYAVVDCTAHARLWLSGMDHNIYMESDLTYAELGRRRVAKEQQEVYAFIYLKERVPSCVELRQRFMCHDHICGFWGGEMEVLILSAKDYDVLGAPDNEMWRAARKHIRLSMLYREGRKVDPELILRQLVNKYRPLLDVDQKWARLHPSLRSSHLQIPQSIPSNLVVFSR